MDFSIIGLPGSGKTTIFNALTHSYEEDKYRKENLKQVKVPDYRLEFYARVFESKKVVYQEINFHDYQGFELKGEIRNVEAFVVSLRSFTNPQIPFSELKSPLDQLKAILEEMIISDLTIVENRLHTLNKVPDKKVVNQSEVRVLEKCVDLLSDHNLLRDHIKNKNELGFIQGFQLCTLKPLIICINISEDDLGKESSPKFGSIREFCKESGFEYLFLSAAIEEELADLTDSEAREFMEALGIKETAINKLIEKSFRSLNLITFYTAGPKEAHAWVLSQGSDVYAAAGKIHTDIQKGFIKAEVIHYPDFQKFESVSEVKQAGLFKLVGKDYIVQDGDYIVVRFNN